MSTNESKPKTASTERAFGWTLILSILLAWLPVLGPFIAGFTGGRIARLPMRAFIAVLGIAALWGFGLAWLAQKDIKIGSMELQAGPLSTLGIITAVSIISGALMGSVLRPAKVLGFLAIAGVLVYYRNDLRSLWNTGRELRSTMVTPYKAEKNQTCPQNLAKLYNALRMYADSWDGDLPPADRWMTAIKDNVSEDTWFHCPEVSHGMGTKYGYSMNPSLGGKKLQADKTAPLLYDSTDMVMDAHSGIDSLPSPGRHMGRSNVLYEDGHIEQK